MNKHIILFLLTTSLSLVTVIHTSESKKAEKHETDFDLTNAMFGCTSSSDSSSDSETDDASDSSDDEGPTYNADKLPQRLTAAHFFSGYAKNPWEPGYRKEIDGVASSLSGGIGTELRRVTVRPRLKSAPAKTAGAETLMPAVSSVREDRSLPIPIVRKEYKL